MKIHEVVVSGFGPYRDKQVIDFDSFHDDGVFLITGPTGTGKSSVLDAITFALFGSIPRSITTEETHYRSHHCRPEDPTYVEVSFTVPAGTFSVRRSPQYERPKSRGEGMTTQAVQAQLSQYSDGEWTVLETQARNVGRKLSGLIKLNAEQFQQVVLLAQGKFAEFLDASSDERERLLRELFGTRRFADYQEKLKEKADDLKKSLTASEHQLGVTVRSLADEAHEDVPARSEKFDTSTGVGVHEWAELVVDKHTEVVEKARQTAGQTVAVRDSARVEFDQLKSVSDRQARLMKVQEEQRELTAKTADMEAVRQRLETALRAEQAWPSVRAKRSALQKHRSAQARLAKSQGTYQARGHTLTAYEDVADHVNRLTEQRGGLHEAAEKEQSIEDLQAKAGQARTELESFDNTTATWQSEQEEREVELEKIRVEVEQAKKLASELPLIRQQLTTLSRQIAAAERAEELSEDLEKARVHALECGRARTAASARLDELRAAQLAGYSSVIAEQLRPGEPCQVCGSTEHPQPAQPAPDRVTQEQVEVADTEFKRAQEEAADAERSVTQLAAELQGARKEAGEVELTELRRQHAALTGDVEIRERHEGALEQLEKRIEQTRQRINDARESLEKRNAQRQSLAADAVRIETQVVDTVARIAESRGEYTSVAERLAELDKDHAVAKEFLDSMTAAKTAADQYEEASHQAAVSLTEHGFTTEHDVEQARIDANQRTDYDAQLRQFDVRLEAVKRELRSKDLQDLPAERVDLEPARQAMEEALAAYEQAQADFNRRDQQLTSMRRCLEIITKTLSSSVDIQRTYEQINALALTARGQGQNAMKMSLETFALAAELEDILQAANQRLAAMTGQRYELHHNDERARGGNRSGLGITVLDAHTGTQRPPSSLSGGEKFMTSLSLALGLAEVVTNRAGGMRLDTLFIDEGFGSLDSETLDDVMAIIDGLREGGRTIALISHVEQMKDSIVAKLVINRSPEGWSYVST